MGENWRRRKGEEEENSLLGKGGEGERLLALLGHPFPLPLLDLKVEEQFVIRWREGRGRCGKWGVKGRENDPLCFPELRTIAALAFSKCFLCEVGRVRLRFLPSHFPPARPIPRYMERGREDFVNDPWRPFLRHFSSLFPETRLLHSPLFGRKSCLSAPPPPPFILPLHSQGGGGDKPRERCGQRGRGKANKSLLPLSPPPPLFSFSTVCDF